MLQSGLIPHSHVPWMAHDLRLGRNKSDNSERPQIKRLNSISCLENSCLISLFWMIGVVRERRVRKWTDEKAKHCSWIIAWEIEVDGPRPPHQKAQRAAVEDYSMCPTTSEIAGSLWYREGIKLPQDRFRRPQMMNRREVNGCIVH